MKNALTYSLILLCTCFAQPALAQHFESDEDFERQAARKMNLAPQPAKKAGATTATSRGGQPMRRQQSMGGYPAMPRRSSSSGFGSYGFRPGRGSIGSGYGYRPQRADLMPAGQAEKMQLMRARLQQMQQRMMGAGAAGGMGGMGGLGAAGGGQGGAPNMLQQLMGGGGMGGGGMGGGGMGGMSGGAQMPQQRPGANPMAGEMLKSLFGGGGGASDASGL